MGVASSTQAAVLPPDSEGAHEAATWPMTSSPRPMRLLTASTIPGQCAAMGNVPLVISYRQAVAHHEHVFGIKYA